MYNIGAYVSYRAEGICVLTEIKRQKFGVLDEYKDFYVLSPLKDPNSKLFVPTDSQQLVGKMRPLCSAEDVNALADTLLKKRLDWEEQSRRRSNSFKNILADGDRESLIMLIHTISEREDMLSEMGKHVTQSDMTALEKAKKMLINEFSFTTDITDEKTLMTVINCLGKCKDK